MVDYTLSFTIAVVQEKAKGIPELRRFLSGQKMAAFATDISLVGHSVRTGYLLDIFSPQNPIKIFTHLLDDLRGDLRTRDHFTPVFHLYEPSSHQSFFVNKALLFQRIEGYNKPESPSAFQERVVPRPIFVHLTSNLEIIEPPVQLVELLASLLDLISTPVTPLSHSLANNTPVEVAVPLAAIILDYPVAYVPSVSHQNGLSGTPLDIYECFLSFAGQHHENEREESEVNHTIMKFSCPAELAHTCSKEYPGLQPQLMIEGLQNMFRNRIRSSSSIRITTINHCIRTLYQVSF